MLTIGSLATGYGGLDLAVERLTGAKTVWVSEVDPGACTILAHRFPGVPNLGDFTRAYWARVPHVDIFTAGYPCQPFSHAGRRKGTDDAQLKALGNGVVPPQALAALQHMAARHGALTT